MFFSGETIKTIEEIRFISFVLPQIMKVVILENVRSAYNVGNIVRTADALGRKVRIVGYTPSPLDHPKVRKTSLGAEETTDIQQFNSTHEAIQKAKEL